MAPEIILNQRHTPAMDVFSLGVVLFIMLVGRKPFNIKECENLSYCNLDLRVAPGLEDPRCVASHTCWPVRAVRPATVQCCCTRTREAARQ